MNENNVYLNNLNNLLEAENKYLVWYNVLIEKYLSRGEPPKGYFERHHIYPVCFCDNDKKLIRDKRNRVNVTAREHFVLHRILSKLNFKNPQNKKKMEFAITIFTRNKSKRKLTSRQYEIAKKYASSLFKGRKLKDSTRRKLSAHRIGKTHMYDKDGNLYTLDVSDPLIKELDLHGNRKNMVTVKDLHGNTFTTTKDDIRLTTGELKGVRAGKATYITKSGERVYLNVNDPLIHDEGLIGVNKGKTSKKPEGHSKGSANSMYGRKNEVCCFDTIEKRFLRISKDVFDSCDRFVGVNNVLAKQHRLLLKQQ